MDRGGEKYAKITEWQSWKEYRDYEEWIDELPGGGDLPWALFYPAGYSIGSSSLGFHYIYRMLRESGAAVERFFESPIPYRSADNDTLLERFPVITASVSYEGNAEAFFRWLAGASIPLSPRRRMDGGYPVVGAGGAMTYINPFLLSGVCDFIVLGDAMDALPYIAGALRSYLSDGDREKLWSALAAHGSVFVPPIEVKDGKVACSKHLNRSLPLSDDYPMHSAWITEKSAFGSTLLLELQRGCARSCRYCTLPGSFGRTRYRSFESIRPRLDVLVRKNNFSQIGLVTPEAGDYVDIDSLLDYIAGSGKGVSFASLRLDRLTEKMLSCLVKGGRQSITVAPETGNDALRFSAGKKFTNDLILDKLVMARDMGINRVKLYFMLGLPGESDADVASIAELCAAAAKKTSQSLVLSVSPFVPKPGTPWEREGFAGVSAVKRKYKILSSALRSSFKRPPQVRLTGPKEAEREFLLAWYGFAESKALADGIEGGAAKLPFADRAVTADELKKLFLK